MGKKSGTPRRNFVSLEIGRFLAALFVAAFHASGTVRSFDGQFPFDDVVRAGHAGVEYFFLLSGFLMFWIHGDDAGKPGATRGFALKRMIRIVPMYWLIVSIFVVLTVVSPHLGKPRDLSLHTIVENYALLADSSRLYLGAAWTLQRELIFYALFALGLLFPRIGSKAFWLWQITIIGANIVDPELSTGPRGNVFLGVYNLGFGVGGLIALSAASYRVGVSNSRLIALMGALLFGVLFTIEWRLGATTDHWVVVLGDLTSPLYYMAAAALLIFGFVQYELQTAIKGHRVLRLLGDSSYTLYLFHGLFISLIVRGFAGNKFPFGAETAFIASIGVAVTGACVLFKLIEAPILRYLRRTLLKKAAMNKRSCVIIVENLPVPFDRRVWQEALTLKRAGWDVSVICPATQRHPQTFEWLEGIAIYRHRLPLEARGKSAFLLEYSLALFHEFRLLCKVWWERGFYVIQACNPPDLIFFAALPFKLIGKQFLFDHHDVNPELFEAKFKRKGLIHRFLLLFEKSTFLTADLVVSANHTFRDIAISRGGKRPEEVVTVYSVPDKSRIRRVAPDETVRKGKTFVLGYVGIIGDQDGVDHMVGTVEYLIRNKNFTDFHAVIVGDGPALASTRDLAISRGLDEFITFTGYLSGDALLRHLSSFDVGVIPDPVNTYNDKISMNKVFEYTALGIPSVAYPLTETRRLLGEAAVYADGIEPSDLANACFRLLSDNELRSHCSEAASRLSADFFSWDREAEKYLAAYENLIGRVFPYPESGRPKVAI